MRARDVMSSPVITVTPETSLKEAASLLSSHGFTALPVVDDDDQLIGIVTEADLIRDRIPKDPRYRHGDTGPGTHPSIPMTVRSVMTTPATGMGQGTDVNDLCQALVDARIRAMPIVDGGTVVGIVTRGDIIRVLARTDHAIAIDVRHRLEIYGGANRWTVDVRDGSVRIEDAFDSEADRHVATLLALAVPGVVDAETVSSVKGTQS
ncbi:HPP family protein [Amycolatopsis sp. NPDC059657]|uniref:CBS domain-containing protein n=1 Tax=Amycolatopsis sp. NPDC059657 TaxID=3346899 RepID=UPI0036705D08